MDAIINRLELLYVAIPFIPTWFLIAKRKSLSRHFLFWPTFGVSLLTSFLCVIVILQGLVSVIGQCTGGFGPTYCEALPLAFFMKGNLFVAILAALGSALLAALSVLLLIEMFLRWLFRSRAGTAQ